MLYSGWKYYGWCIHVTPNDGGLHYNACTGLRKRAHNKKFHVVSKQQQRQAAQLLVLPGAARPAGAPVTSGWLASRVRGGDANRTVVEVIAYLYTAILPSPEHPSPIVHPAYLCIIHSLPPPNAGTRGCTRPWAPRLDLSGGLRGRAGSARWPTSSTTHQVPRPSHTTPACSSGPVSWRGAPPPLGSGSCAAASRGVHPAPVFP